MTFYNFSALEASKQIAVLFLLTPMTERVIYQLLYLHEKHQGKVFPCLDTIAKHCRCSKRTVQRALRLLADLELIEIQPRYTKVAGITRQLSNLYRVTGCLAFIKKKVKTGFLSLRQLLKDPNKLKCYRPDADLRRSEFFLYWNEAEPQAVRPVTLWQTLFDGFFEDNSGPGHYWVPH